MVATVVAAAPAVTGGGGAGIATGGNGNSGEGGGGSSDSNHASAPQKRGSDCGSGGGSNSSATRPTATACRAGVPPATPAARQQGLVPERALDKQRRIDGVRHSCGAYKSTAFAGFDSTTSHWATVPGVVRTAATLGWPCMSSTTTQATRTQWCMQVMQSCRATAGRRRYLPTSGGTPRCRLHSCSQQRATPIVAFNGTNHYNGVCPIGHSKPASEGGAPLHSNEPHRNPWQISCTATASIVALLWWLLRLRALHTSRWVLARAAQLRN